MNATAFTDWMEGLKTAWTTKNPRQAAELCTENVVYHESPFGEPLIGRDAVEKEWSGVPDTQDAIDFRYEIVAVTGDTGIARWRVSFVRLPSRTVAELDGVFIVTLDTRGLCREFRQWWNAKQT
jgi:hypothetical protein